MKILSKISYLFIFITMLFVTGCTSTVNELEHNNSTFLNLSEEVVYFSKEEGNKIVEISTNEKMWVATSPEEGKWIKIFQTEDALIISSTKNETGRERSGFIMINAGNQSAIITVKQQSAEAFFELSDTSFIASSQGGTYQMSVNSNQSEWNLEGAELFPWIKAKKIDNSRVQIDVMPNTTYDKRIAKIYIRGEATVQEILITQLADAQFLLPYMLENGKSRGELFKFEEARGSRFLGIQPLGGGKTVYSFMANDQYSSTISYTFDNGDQLYSAASIKSDNAIYGLNPEFEKMLSTVGFVKNTSKKDEFIDGVWYKDYIYTDINFTLNATIKTSESKNWTFISFIATDGQGKNYPTFKVFPFRNKDYFNKADYFEVKKWEETDGNSIGVVKLYGNTNPNVVYFAEFAPITKEEGTRVATIYFFEEEKEAFMGKLWQRTDFYKNIEIAMWKNSKGRYELTNEMKDLLGREGFLYQGYNGQYDMTSYLKPDESLVLFLKVYSNYENYNDRKPVLGLIFYKPDLTGSSKMQSPFEQEEHFKSIMSKIDRSNKMWLKKK